MELRRRGVTFPPGILSPATYFLFLFLRLLKLCWKNWGLVRCCDRSNPNICMAAGPFLVSYKNVVYIN